MYVLQEPIYVAIPYHAARPFTVREAVIKAQTTEGDWTILNSTEVTFDTLNYKVRHVLLRFSCGYLIQRNTAAIDYTMERGAVAQRFFRHIIPRLNIVRGGSQTIITEIASSANILVDSRGLYICCHVCLSYLFSFYSSPVKSNTPRPARCLIYSWLVSSDMFGISLDMSVVFDNHDAEATFCRAL